MKMILNLLKISAVLFLLAIIFALVGVIFEIILGYWLWLALTAIIIVFCFYLHKNPNCIKRKRKPTVTITSLQKQDQIPEITTVQEYSDFLESHVLIRSFITKVVGVTYLNDDGSNRQDILSLCLVGEPVVFHWYTFHGAPACAVVSEHGQIGNLNAELASDLDIDYGIGDYVFIGKISDILGGEDGLSYGCRIMISIYGPA